MKQLIIVTTILISAVVLADGQTNATNRARRKLNREQMMERWNIRTGGEILVPNSQKGKIVFVNAQDTADESLIAEVADTFVKSHRLKIEVEKGEFSLPNPVVKGNASLFIVNDSGLPTILHAPEDRWTMVNVARLGGGNGSKRQFYVERVKKEVTRGFCLLAGTQTSNYPESLLTSVTTPGELDRFVGCRLQVDIQERFAPYLKGFGITPARFSTYLEACQEGWAPAPTNDVQKAIWDKVHALPTAPIKIKPEEKKTEK